MSSNIIYSNDFVKIANNPDGVFIETFKKGYPFDQLNKVLSLHPEIDILNFNIIKNAIFSAPKPPEKFGKMKERIIVDLLDNDLKAIITFNLPQEELNMANMENVISEAAVSLRAKGITCGIKKEIFSLQLQSAKPYVIAEGIPPIHGTDCIIKMYEMKEPKPEIHEDGKVNFYELELINRVVVGEWLGERIEATGGIPGQSVKGVAIKPIPGKSYPLNYDKNTVKEVLEGDKATLYSRVNGAVNYDNDKIGVSNHLEIDGDVDFKTGNVKFDGYLTIKGTVTDGFSVEATRDIEINGPLGLGNIKEIVSTCGSIFIKGGISAKGRAEIRAEKDVFIKFVDNAYITCGGTVHIGFYCVNSTITAKEVVIDSTKGQIIGGNIKAEIKVTAATIGSEREKRTIVEVTGFERNALKDELVNIIHTLNNLKTEQQKLKQLLSSFDAKSELNPFQHKERDSCFERMLAVKEEAKLLEDKRKDITRYLKTRGEGEIYVTKRIHANCMLIIKRNVMEMYSPTLATSIFVQDGEIKQV